jgi:glutamate/aspartate transport system substrate-binding protein
MNRVALAISMALTVLTMLAGSALAAELTGTLKKVRDTRTLTLGYREASRPFSFVGDDGKPAGYSVDLCVRIAAAVQKQLGLPNLALKWVKVVPQDRITMVANGTIDIECGSTTNTLGRQEHVDFTSMTFVDGGSFLVTDASGIDRVADLDGKRVALIPGTTTEKALAEATRMAGVTPQLVHVRDHGEGVAALDSGGADAYASDRVLLIGLGRTSKAPSKLSMAREYFSYEPYALMVRRGDAAFRLVANRELSRLYRTREVVEIYEKWFGDMGRPGTLLLAVYILHGLPE